MQDMTLPLSHYYVLTAWNAFVDKGHRTAKGRSRGAPSVKALRRVLCSTNVRCIHLSVHEQNPGWLSLLPPFSAREPIVFHIAHAAKPVTLRSCLATIRECAFEASPFPLLLLLDDYCSRKGMQATAEILKQELGDKLFVPEGPTINLHSPARLRQKVVLIHRDNASGRRRYLGPHPALQRLVYLSFAQFSNLYASRFSPSPAVTEFTYERVDEHARDGSSAIMEHSHRHFVLARPSDVGIDAPHTSPLELLHHGVQLATMHLPQADEGVWAACGFFRTVNEGAGFVLKPKYLRKDTIPRNLFADPFGEQSSPQPHADGDKDNVIVSSSKVLSAKPPAVPTTQVCLHVQMGEIKLPARELAAKLGRGRRWKRRGHRKRLAVGSPRKTSSDGKVRGQLAQTNAAEADQQEALAAVRLRRVPGRGSQYNGKGIQIDVAVEVSVLGAPCDQRQFTVQRRVTPASGRTAVIPMDLPATRLRVCFPEIACVLLVVRGRRVKRPRRRRNKAAPAASCDAQPPVSNTVDESHESQGRGGDALKQEEEEKEEKGEGEGADEEKEEQESEGGGDDTSSWPLLGQAAVAVEAIRSTAITRLHLRDERNAPLRPTRGAIDAVLQASNANCETTTPATTAATTVAASAACHGEPLSSTAAIDIGATSPGDTNVDDDGDDDDDDDQSMVEKREGDSLHSCNDAGIGGGRHSLHMCGPASAHNDLKETHPTLPLQPRHTSSHGCGNTRVAAFNPPPQPPILNS